MWQARQGSHEAGRDCLRVGTLEGPPLPSRLPEQMHFYFWPRLLWAILANLELGCAWVICVHSVV